jgi:hypothetical protein
MKSFWRLLFRGKKVSNRRLSVRLTLEPFESRDLPNAAPLFAAMHQLSLGTPAHMGASNAGSSDTSYQGHYQGQDQTQTQTLAAHLTGATGTSGIATFRSNATSGDNSLNIQVSGLTAHATYTVMSGTTKVGTITTNANGRGFLSVSKVSPTLTAGATISVLDSAKATVLSGKLATLSPTPFTRLSASLRGATGTAGTAQYDDNATSGENSLRLRVSGLSADSTYTVKIGDTTVGRINTDADGRGWLSESLSTTVSSGSAITILNSKGTSVLQGTFAADTGNDGWGHHR